MELWDVGSRSTREELPIEAFWLKFSPQGRYLAAADFGRFVVWDLNARAVRHEWPRGYVSDAAFTDDEEYLAATTFPLEGDRPLSLELWRLSDGARVAVRPFGIRGRAQAFAVAIAPDQRRLVVSPSPGDLLFLRLPDLAEEGRLAVHDDRIISLAYSPDGRWLAAGSGFRDSVVRLWDLRDGPRVYSLRGHAGWVRSVTFSKDSRFLASASSDQSARIWDVQSKSELRILRGHQSQLFSVDFGPDGDLLVTGAKLGEAKLWSLAGQPGGGERRNLPPLTLPDLSRDHRWFAGVSPAGRVVWGGVSEPSVVHELPAAGTNGLVARFSPDAGWLAVGGRRGEVELHSRTTGERRIAPAVHRHPIRILWFTHLGGGLVSMDESGHGVCWTDDLRSTREWQLPPECALVYLALEPVRGFLIADMRGQGRRVYRLSDGGVEAALNGGGIGPTAAALSPDGKLLAISDDDGTVEVWDVRTWSLAASLRGHLAAVGSVAFSPDGRRLVTGSNGSEAVRFWEVNHWQQVCDLPVLSAYNLFLSFSNDGRSLAFSTGPHLQVLRID